MGGCCRSPAPGGGRGRAGLGSFAPGFLLRAEYSPGHGSVIESVARFGPIAQLGERRVRNAEVVSSILIRSTISGEQTNSVPLFFSCCAPVMARFLARVRRTPLPRVTPIRAVFRSLFPPILCFCEGRLRARASSDAGFRLLVRNEKHSANRLRKLLPLCP